MIIKVKTYTISSFHFHLVDISKCKEYVSINVEENLKELDDAHLEHEEGDQISDH